MPLPGITLKLVPNGTKLEVRVKGPTVTSGYHNDPEKTAAAFDEEGYYKLGDACRFLNPDGKWEPVPGGEYRSLPFRCGHLEVELPPGCYWVTAGYVGQAVMETNASRLFVLSVAPAFDGPAQADEPREQARSAGRKPTRWPAFFEEAVATTSVPDTIHVACPPGRRPTAPARRRTGAIAAGASEYTTITARALIGNRVRYEAAG